MKSSSLKKILLSSPTSKNELAESYKCAINDAEELYIASAYLTNWATNVRLNSHCVNLLFLVGTDFGITRKNACKDVLKWLPKKFYGSFLAVPNMNDGGFHPKIVAWKDTQNKCHCIIGSSNLTEAAFNSNYEANVEVSISKEEFIKIRKWIEYIGKYCDCQVIDDGWINQYKERILSGGGRNKIIKPVINLPIPDSKIYVERIMQRRESEKLFVKIKAKLKKEMVLCSRSSITNREFWNRFWALWSKHPSRMQGSGIQFSGKKANWRVACNSFLRIVNSPSSLGEISLDRIVKDEIDKLRKLKNPMRGAWFSEILCHFFPDEYPLQNKPVKIYLKVNKWKPQRGLSEGGKYIDLAKKLRNAIRQNKNKNGPRNMPELDNVIYTWCERRGLLDKGK